MKKPLIGLTLDIEQPGGYSKFPWYALRQNYCDAIASVGGIPLPLAHNDVDSLLDKLDGLLITGGNFDVDPALFGATEKHQSVSLKEGRTNFEFDITKKAYKKDLPILGICGGEQLLNVVLGGTLIQHIPDQVENALEHEQKNPRNEPGHFVEVLTGTQLFDIVGSSKMNVNSAHHQSVDKLGWGLKLNAKTSDGVVEGFEDPNKRFCLGIQWHPEFFIDPGDKKIFEAFIHACQKI